MVERKKKEGTERRLVKDFGARLKQLREKHGLSQAEFARMVGIHKSHLVRYEQGQSSPTAEKIIALCRVLHVTADALLRGDRKGEEAIEFANLRLYERMRTLDQMSRNDQQTVLDVIDALIARHEVHHISDRTKRSA